MTRIHHLFIPRQRIYSYPREREADGGVSVWMEVCASLCYQDGRMGEVVTKGYLQASFDPLGWVHDSLGQFCRKYIFGNELKRIKKEGPLYKP